MRVLILGGVVLGALGLVGCDTQSSNLSSPTHASPDQSQSSGRAYSGVYLEIPTTNQITDLTTTMKVPAEPSMSGTLFLWPGLQPRKDGMDFSPVGYGVLQPVLTWGPSCAPGNQPILYSTWWVSAQYVNTSGSVQGLTGCLGGDVMPVNVGDSLSIEISLNGTSWTQTITDAQSGRSVSYVIDLKGQAQNDALFEIETYGQYPVGDVEFSNTSVTFASPVDNCEFFDFGSSSSQVDRGDSDSTPSLSNGNHVCSIASIILHDPVSSR